MYHFLQKPGVFTQKNDQCEDRRDAGTVLWAST